MIRAQPELGSWLDPDLSEPAALLPLLAPCADALLTAYPVSTLVNAARNDGPELIAPLAEGEAPAPATRQRHAGPRATCRTGRASGWLPSA